MASSSACSTKGSNKFEASLTNEHHLTLEFDAVSSRLSIEVANSSRFVVHIKSITKTDQVVQITGALRIIFF